MDTEWNEWKFRKVVKVQFVPECIHWNYHHLKIPRDFYTKDSRENIELHFFSDAISVTFAACTYPRQCLVIENDFPFFIKAQSGPNKSDLSFLIRSFIDSVQSILISNAS